MKVDLTTGEITEPDCKEVAALLIEHMGGRAHETASKELHQLIAAVTEHGKKGSLTITITVEAPKGHVDGGPLAIGIASILKAPKAVTPAAIYFVDREGNPTRNDPRQLSFDSLREAPAAPSQFKDAR